MTSVAAPLDAVARLTTAIGTAESLSATFDAALNGLRDVFSIERASIQLFDAEGTMRFRAWRGLSDEYRSAVEGHTPWILGQAAPAPVVVPDVAQDKPSAKYRAVLEREGIRGLGFFPLVSDRGVIGKFMLYKTDASGFTSDQVHAAIAIGFVLGLAVERTQRHEALHARTTALLAQEEELRTLLTTLTDGSYRLLTSVTADRAVQEVLTLAERVIAADAYAVWRRQGQEWAVAGSRGLSEAFTSDRVPYDRSLPFTEPIVVADVADGTLAEPRQRAYRAEGIHAVMSVPLAVRGEPSGGVVFYYRRPHQPSEVELRVAVALAHLSAAAIRNVELYEEQQVLAVENARLYAEAQQANRLKDEFLASLSHELRTPLNVIAGRTQMLLKVADVERARDLAQIIDRNSATLVKLVEDLLDVSRMTIGQIRLDRQHVSLDAVVTAAIQAVQSSADAKRISVRASLAPGAVVNGDPTRLQQIAWNLLTNAVKFTPPDGCIDVETRVDGSMVALSVQDSGCGLEAQDLPRVFDMFWQSEPSTSRRPGGLGLGLSIVRRLAELHGGTAAAASAGQGRGSIFTVTIPRVRDEQAGVESAVREGASHV